MNWVVKNPAFAILKMKNANYQPTVGIFLLWEMFLIIIG